MSQFVASCRLAVLIVLTSLITQESFAGPAIKFNPGGVDGCGAHVNRMNGGMSLATLDQYEDVSQFLWVVLNKSPASVTGLPDARHILITINTPTGANGTAPANSTFTMEFTMNLQSIDGVGGSKQYGVDNPNGNVFTDNSRTTLGPLGIKYPTHVYVEASLQGLLPTGLSQVSYPPSQLASAHPRFTQAKFRMFFDADGDPASTNDRVLIAKFGTTSIPNSLSTIAQGYLLDLVGPDIIVNWDAAVPGVFADKDGHELAIGPIDSSDPTLRQVSVATQPTSEMEFSFRAQCALSGSCTISNSNSLSFRLHTYDGYAGLISVPTSTVNPGKAACPPDPTNTPYLVNQLSPVEFPYKITIESKCVESVAGLCLRTEITKTCVGGNCFNVPPGKIPGPVCIRCLVGTTALGGLLVGGILAALWMRRRQNL